MRNYAIITRMHYPKDERRWPFRIGYFRDEVLPRLLRQTFHQFAIAVWCEPWHEAEVRSLSDRIATFQVNARTRYKVANGKRYFVDFAPWSAVTGIPRFDVQVGLDSDDLVREDFMQRVDQEITEHAGLGSLHVSFQPELYDARTRKTGPIGSTYGPRKGSAFFALYQPPFSARPYRFAYEDSHLKLWRFADKSVTVEKGYCWATAHGANESTGISRR